MLFISELKSLNVVVDSIGNHQLGDASGNSATVARLPMGDLAAAVGVADDVLPQPARISDEAMAPAASVVTDRYFMGCLLIISKFLLKIPKIHAHLIPACRIKIVAGAEMRLYSRLPPNIPSAVNDFSAHLVIAIL